MINCTSVRRHFSLNACANPKDCNVIPFVAPVKIKFAPHSNGKSAGDKPPFSGSEYLWIHGFDKALKLDRSPTSFVCVCLFPPPLPFKDESAGAWFSRTTESCDSIALAKFLPTTFPLDPTKAQLESDNFESTSLNRNLIASKSLAKYLFGNVSNRNFLALDCVMNASRWCNPVGRTLGSISIRGSASKVTLCW